MTKLNQLLAIRKTANNNSNRTFTAAYQSLAKLPLLSGIIKTYRPRDDEGESLPGERQHVQITADKQLHEAVAAFKRMFQVVGEIDNTNCSAGADIVVDGRTLVADVPVTHLLWLEKQLQDLRTFISKLPVLDPALEWNTDNATGISTSVPKVTARSQKVPFPFVKAAATEKHPAQVEVLHKDEVVGEWHTTFLSGAMRAGDVAVLLSRCETVQLAVMQAREQANMADVVKADATALLDYIVQ